jgi:hypothetical protein
MKKDSFCIVYNSGASCEIPGYTYSVGKMRIGISKHRSPKVEGRSWAIWDLVSGKAIKFGFDTKRAAELFLTRNYTDILRSVENAHAVLSIFEDKVQNREVTPRYTLLSAKWG